MMSTVMMAILLLEMDVQRIVLLRMDGNVQMAAILPLVFATTCAVMESFSRGTTQNTATMEISTILTVAQGSAKWKPHSPVLEAILHRLTFV
jgi:hypothetical protein